MRCHGPCYSIVFDPRPSLMIKGGPEDEAVLCTSGKTYNIRSVTLSNSVLLVSPSPHDMDGSENQVVIQDSLNELLELVPAVPKLHRMNVLLKEHEWEEGHEEEEEEGFRAVSTGDKFYAYLARLIEIIPQGNAETIYSRRCSGRASGQRAGDSASTQGQAYTYHRR